MGATQLGCHGGLWGRWEMGTGARPNTREELPVSLMGSHTHRTNKAPALGLRPAAGRRLVAVCDRRAEGWESQ